MRALLSDDGILGGRTCRLLDALLEAAPAVRRAAEETHAFARLVRERDAGAPEPWLDAAQGGPGAGFAEGLVIAAAVTASLAPPRSDGPAEG